MSTMCKGSCAQFKSESHSPANKYQMNVKWCSRCSLFMEVDSLRCPCCNSMLRTKSRHKKKTIVKKPDSLFLRQTLLVSRHMVKKSTQLD